MLSINSKIIKRGVIALVIVLVLGIVGNWFLEYKINSVLKTSFPNAITLNYEDLGVSALGRSLSMDNVSFSLKDSVSQQILGDISIERLDFKNFGVFDYLNNKTIALNRIKVSNVKGYLKLPDHIAKDSTSVSEKPLFDKVSFGKVELEHIALQLMDQKTDSVVASITDLNLNVNGVKANLIDDRITLSYEDYAIATDSLKIALGPFNNLKIASINGTQDSTVIASAELKTKYNPIELLSHITHEMDYYDLKVGGISIQGIPKSFATVASPLNIGKVIIQNPDAFIYRDKLVADDLRVKPMFSEMIRNIPVDFTISGFEINNASLTYKERVHDYNDGGSLSIENGFIGIPNLSNIAEHQPLSIDINASLSDTGIIKANWQFDVLNDNDDFAFTADVSHINLEAINTFSRPNFNTEMEGHIDKLYFNISGNKNISHIDVKTKYADTKITILDKSHKSRNKFFSSVANVIVRKDSKNKKSDFREAKADVVRDKTKSGINYIFRNVKTGLTKIFL
ncbi:hypothetical protein J4050_08970 [Winogradskyella sp. DF17]|uniref:AsmA-like protein n=1 Tax=Winogradskyella pelagia TaxID=2819984 RepID=A0ABS3T2A6_9FLAO|nr:hypothetical protein [Winogradskyella sp. DF17]MBO3116877.1 hypothetical protein [Winogradskyella sp. DF17]